MSSGAITIDGEHDTDRGWLYTLSVSGDDGVVRDHELTMSWVDHEHLVGGAIPPNLVANASARIALEHFGLHELPARFDVANLRRLVDDFDERVRTMINAPL
ncbi:MAG: hypothetical protein WD114_06745 [Phycisphaerales bacterium]